MSKMEQSHLATEVILHQFYLARLSPARSGGDSPSIIVRTILCASLSSRLKMQIIFMIILNALCIFI